MTGFATLAHQLDEGVVNIELRSVNHRYLEIIFKMDDHLRMFEPNIRQGIQRALKRGKVDCKLSFKENEQAGQQLTVNDEVLKRLSTLVDATQAHFKNTQPVNVLDVLNMPGVLETKAIASSQLLSAIETALPQALTALSKARANEGEKLKAIILERLNEVAALVATVKPMMPALIQAYQAKLTAKLKEMMDVDEERVHQEMAVYAQKIDIDEELSRLEAHVSEVASILEEGGVVGKRLDFLMQEMNREANTLGSKSVSIDTTKVSMQLKVLIEQMREQIQNIE